MLSILISGAVSFLIVLLGTPAFIKFLKAKQYGQFIRQDGPTSHQVKRGTPTMGGMMILVGTVLGYAVANLAAGRTPGLSGILLLFLMVGMGAVGFVDDYAKIRHQQSLGLTEWQKIIGQGIIGVVFAVLALFFRNEQGATPASTYISFVRDSSVNLAFAGVAVGVVLFVLWANFLITAWSNAVNVTDGLDGLAAGASMIAFAAYTIITLWQSNHLCTQIVGAEPGCYQIRDPRDLVMIAAAITGAVIGFLWWNTNPAQIFMSDTGSLALGAAFAGLSILSHTEFLAILIGGLYLIEVGSVSLQMGVFKITKKLRGEGYRVFRMAPFHHHFEKSVVNIEGKGWEEITVVTRFWLIQLMFAALALGVFYAEWLAVQ